MRDAPRTVLKKAKAAKGPEQSNPPKAPNKPKKAKLPKDAAKKAHPKKK